MPLTSSICVGGAFQRKTDLTKPATPDHAVVGGATTTNVQYVVSPHTTASHALNNIGPPDVAANPHGSLPSAACIRAFARCWPSSLANAVDPKPRTMHCAVFGRKRSSAL